MNKKIGKMIVTMFGVGHIKYFPGTFASFITASIYYIFYTIKINYFLLILINLLLFIYSVLMINYLEGEFEEIDSKEIVIDEFLGQSIPILFFYIIFYEGSVSNHFFLIIVFLSFIGFRFFDILKPYPINHVDKNMKNGFGVILDDLLAGFFTLIVLYICIIFYGQI
ncbi:phosphatidylglycerophosphatase A [Candidatus Pelagibacter sp.]|nr:phosphatidylglycerophosphatase A [Candidatus Pelagibacter sp.]